MGKVEIRSSSTNTPRTFIGKINKSQECVQQGESPFYVVGRCKHVNILMLEFIDYQRMTLGKSYLNQGFLVKYVLVNVFLAEILLILVT